ncbi:MAG TPA: hypothetical protein VFZ62_00115 [Candidatus Saccharimonadales bacterium]
MQTDSSTSKKAQAVQIGAWALAAGVVLAAGLAWGEVRLNGGALSAYDVFPLFGLLAFSLMWTHYVSGAVRRLMDLDTKVLSGFFRVTSAAVLVLLLLHPTIFLTQLWADGFGLPPFSYLQVYEGGAERLALLLGTLSLLAFLLFEFHRKFKNASWWKYIEYANLAAMAAIFYHALTLGGELDLMWYKMVWFTYGILLVMAVVTNKIITKRRKT